MNSNYINKCIMGDCLEVMKEIPDKTIDLTVTSPPYDNLRTYNGYTFNFEDIAKELYRITKDGGIVVWVVGDATIKGSETGTSFKQALYFKEIGFNIHDTMIYSSSKPPLTHNRYEQEFEYMFVLSKGKPKTFNPIKIRCLNAGKKSGGTIRKTGNELLEKNKPGKVNDLKISGNIWRFNTGNTSSSDRISFKHPAIFPEKLAEDHILSWSNEGDVVFDPMAGSGTTLKMAKKNNRNFIGCEISSEYCDIIKERVGCEIINLTDKLPDYKPSRFKEKKTFSIQKEVNKLVKDKCPKCNGLLKKTKYGMTCEDCLSDY